jgi:D-glycero-alpha-D-manno-heptose 1-phosphate guanylyltransferase
MKADEAIILVGGLGTRLRGVISDVPKPLAPVAGRPFLAWVLDNLAEGGLRRVVLAAGYMAEKVQGIFGTYWLDMEIAYAIEETPLGTGGAIRHASGQLDGSWGVHVVNGDTFLRYSPASLEHMTRQLRASIGMAVAAVADVSRYGAIEVVDGRVMGLREKGQDGAGYINAGCYFLTEDALSELPPGPSFSWETEVLAPWAKRGAVAAYAETDGFIDIGVPEDYLRAQALFGTTP